LKSIMSTTSVKAGQILSSLIVLLGSVFLCPDSCVAGDFEDYSKQEAAKVMKLIEQIQRDQAEGITGGSRRVVVTESELNAYFAYRIEAEHSEVMKELRVKVFEKNRIEGKIFIDLRGQALPKILRPEMNFYLDGTIEVKDGLGRLNLKSLYLENQKIQPEILNLVIYVGSKSQNMEPFRLDDWFELPYGIKNITSEKGRAIFHY